MTGAIIQLQLKGQQDYGLTGDPPQFNFIKQIYKRHVNFALQTYSLISNSTSDFGDRVVFEIPRKGDLLHKVSLTLTLPPLKHKSGTYAGWTNSVGHAIIDYADLEIGGQIIDRNYGLFMEIWNEITLKPGIRSVEDQLIGKYAHMKSLWVNAVYTTQYAVPLKFWFCNNIGSALPLIALQFHTIRIIIKLRPFSECIVYDGDIPPNPVVIAETGLLTEYVYLDDAQREKYSGTKFTYLINQIQTIEGQSVGQGGIYRASMSFNHPISELLWILRELESENNNDWFNFGIRNNVLETPIFPLMKNAKFIIDGTERSTILDQSAYNLYALSRAHTNVSDKYVYVLPLCNEPEKWYSTGSLNFSLIQEAELILQITEDIRPTKLYIFARNYNFIHITNGMLAVAYST
jgi:hypothetical protein